MKVSGYEIRRRNMSCRMILICFFSIWVTTGVFAWQQKADSLKKLLSKVEDDTIKVRLLNNLAEVLWLDLKFEEGYDAAQKAKVLSESIDDSKGLARAFLQMGRCEDAQSHFDAAIVLYNKAMVILLRIRSVNEMGNVQIALGNAYDFKGNSPKALEYYLFALRSKEETSDSAGAANALVGVGNSYFRMKKYSDALESYFKAIGFYKRHSNKKNVSWMLNNIGSTYYAQGDTSKAISLFMESIQLKKQMNDSFGVSTTYNNLVEIYLDKKDLKNALHYALLSLAIRLKINDTHELSSSYSNVGSVYFKLKDYARAKEYYDKSLKLAELSNSFDLLSTNYLNLSDLYASTGDKEMAYKYHLKYTDAKDSLFNSESGRVLNELSAKYKTEKKDKQLVVKNLEITKKDAEAKTASFVRNAFVAGFILMLGLVFFIFRGFKQKQKANLEIIKQKELIEEKQREILDSIHYAKRIQRSILPTDKYIIRCLARLHP